MDNSCLNIDYVTITDVDKKSFAKNLSFYGKPKGLKDLKDRQKALESQLDAITELQNDLANLTCSSLNPQTLGETSADWGFVDPKTGEVVLNADEKYHRSEKFWILYRCVGRLHGDGQFYDALDNPEPMKLKDILEYFDREIATSGDDLLKVQNEIEKASKPAPVERWRLVFVFSRANVEVVGQAAKNLYKDLSVAENNLNLKMHVKKTDQTKYETKFALIVDSYEIL